MQPDVRQRRALVLGGTGAVGSAVLKELARRGVPSVFTYHRSEDKARALFEELGHNHRPVQVDLADAAATRALFEKLDGEAPRPDVLIHCAGVAAPLALHEIGPEALREAIGVSAESAFLACQWIAAGGRRDADIVIVSALDRTQSLPLPVHFAAAQGMQSAMVMALAHELGPRNIRVNAVALGVLSSGLSHGLMERRRKDYEKFSALRRVGAPEEAARTIVWLALENTYIQGKVISVNGGI
jgi:3-oxoacyl-[acyl-carrier protein] reductase